MAAASLPSPSTTEPSRYFAPPFPPTSSPLAQQQSQQYSNPASTSSSSSSLSQPTSQHASIQPSHSQRPPHHQLPSTYPQLGATATNETSPFLRDFNLVAEAAKRAQMAVLMRDLEGVAL